MFEKVCVGVVSCELELRVGDDEGTLGSRREVTW
jgi:hypothetical protein